MHDWTGGMPAGGAPRVYLKSALQSLPRDICTTTTTFFAPGGGLLKTFLTKQRNSSLGGVRKAKRGLNT